MTIFLWIYHHNDALCFVTAKEWVIKVYDFASSVCTSWTGNIKVVLFLLNACDILCLCKVLTYFTHTQTRCLDASPLPWLPYVLPLGACLMCTVASSELCIEWRIKYTGRILKKYAFYHHSVIIFPPCYWFIFGVSGDQRQEDEERHDVNTCRHN